MAPNEGKSDLLFLATTAAFGFTSNPANMKFHAELLGAVGLLKGKPDEAVSKSLDLRFAKELATELKDLDAAQDPKER